MSENLILGCRSGEYAPYCSFICGQHGYQTEVIVNKGFREISLDGASGLT